MHIDAHKRPREMEFAWLLLWSGWGAVRGLYRASEI